MGISTHILDTTRGRPASDVAVALDRELDGEWERIGSGQTDTDGRLKTLLPEEASPPAGTYRITFAVEAYFAKLGIEAFYPSVSITFRVRDSSEHYHVPLLLSAFGFSTYRGS